MFERYCVGEAYTIKEVLEQFENCNDRVAVVLNDSNKVIGVVSQGDILRALSAGADLYIQISQISGVHIFIYTPEIWKRPMLYLKRKK